MNEMNELFYRDPYCRQFQSTVRECRKGSSGYEIILDDTAFYPEGGGQPGDRGELNGVRVLDTQKKDGEVIHLTNEPLEEGCEVEGILDWNYRFDHMQQHTGEHIVSGLIHQMYGYENIGFHMGSDVVTVDFNGPLDHDACRKIEQKANEVIWSNVAVQVSYPSKSELSSMEYRSKKELNGKVRIVTIPNADVCACCGTHVKQTGEIGLIKILSVTNRKSGVRIEMVSGRRALDAMERISDQNTRVCQLLSAKPYETSAAVEALLKHADEMKMKERARQHSVLEKVFESLGENEKLVLHFEEDGDMTELRKFCDMAVEKKHAGAAAGISHADGKYQYVIISKTKDLKALCKEINSALNGRGGGAPDMIQGSFHSNEDTIRSVLTQILATD